MDLRDYLAVAWPQPPASQQGLPGKQQAAPSTQHGFVAVQQELPAVQQLVSEQLPSLQQSAPPVTQHVAPRGQHTQQLAFEEACELTPKPMSPRTVADTKDKTDRRFIVNSRIRVGGDPEIEWKQGNIHPAQIQ